MLQINPGANSPFQTAPLILGVSNFEGGTPANASTPHTQPLSAEFSDWQRERGDKATQVFCARHVPSGNVVTLRLLPWIATDEQKERSRQRLKLIQWLGPKYGAGYVEDRLDNKPPSILVCQKELPKLSHWLSRADTQQRIRCAYDLIETISKAHAAGLIHGSISSDCVQIDEQDKCRIGYLETLEDPGVCEESAMLEGDLLGLITLLRQILETCLADQEWMNKLAGQRRARLMQLLKQHPEAGECQETVWRWRDLLAELSRNEFVAPATNPFPVDQCPIHSQPQTYQSTQHRDFQSPSVPIPPALEDQTCEVDVVKVRMEHELDESTTEMDLSEGLGGSISQSRLPLPGDTLGRFQLVKQIGQGGMGMVFEGLDLASQRKVAIKILRVTHGDIGHAIRRFRKEARLLQSIRNDFVTQLIETGVESGQHYLAMEFVAGTNLRDWLNTRCELDESSALGLVADIARALIDAHRQEIVHRDIKPENVLLARLIESDLPAKELALSELRVKLSDFGIARQIRQTESMELTRAGAMIGTPAYMSPEQCKSSGEIAPTSDVYSLGILLYRLLTGALPFESDDPMKLVAMHCFDSPPAIQKRNRAISDATADLVSRMLAKDPLHRPADAAQVVAEIERLLCGEPCPFEAHPRLPIVSENRVWKRVFEWELASSSADLWPLVSNTERLNRAIGLQSVKYRTEKDPKLGLRKFGSFKLAGMMIEWEEHPFEWVEGARMGVLREFASGPFRWFSSIVELIPQAAGGTRLIHTVRIEPRNMLGRMVAEIEAGWKGGKSLDRVYRRIDDWIQKSQKKALVDPYETAKSLDRPTERRLTQRLEALVNQGVSLELAAKLGNFIRSATPQTAAQIRPMDLAETLNEPSEAVLDACLIAARNDLLVLRWDILCPTCRAPASSVSWLSEVNQHSDCEACDTEFQSNLANAIELVFQVHPEIRRVDNGQYCIGGPEHSPHVLTQLRMAPGERIEIVVPLAAGDYLLRGPRLAKSLSLRARARAAPSQLDIRLSLVASSNHTPVVRAGRVALQLTNDFDTPQIIRVERTINRSNVVTAAVASALPKFRELFPEQVFRRDIPVATEDLTFMAVRIARSEEIYSEYSEAEAYYLIQKTLQAVEQAVVAHQGAVIKSIGESLLATFQGCTEAVQTAFELAARIREVPELNGIDIGCGIHRGSALVTTQNGRLDYFGTTARTVEALIKHAEATVVVTDAVFTDPEVSLWLEGVGLMPGGSDEQIETLQLPGGVQRLVRIIPFKTHQSEVQP